MTTTLNLDHLLEQRCHNFRQRPERAVHTVEEASRFIDEVGFALRFPHRGMLLPSLWEAHAGRSQPVFRWDEGADQVWRWRNELSEARRAFYGKYLGAPTARGGFVSPEMMPLFIAAAGGIQDEADLEAEYTDGNLRRDLLVAYRAIRDHGPAGTVALRRVSGLAGPKLGREAEELERRFLVVRLGGRREGRRRWPSNFYDLLSRAYPELATEASEYEVREASRQVVERYLGAAVFATAADISGALGWPLAQAEVALGDLVTARRARPAADEEGLPPGATISMLEARDSRLEHRASKT